VLHLLMVGDGELKAECENYVHAHKLCVSFAGFLNQTEIISAYVAADCLVLPSDAGETWGLVTNEAMACQLPAIVSSQVGCASDLIISGQTGEVFPFGDWTVLSQLLADLGINRERCRQMGRNAQQHIGDYSPAQAARGILAAVESLT
jgi:glycosyltransferase involved in cell wall biosynthesis